MIPGCCKNNVERSHQNPKIREKVYYDEGQYTGSVSQSSGGILFIIVIITIIIIIIIIIINNRQLLDEVLI